MRDALRTGVVSGACAAVLIALAETAIGWSASAASGASPWSLVLAPVFYLAVLLPAGAVAGGVLGMWQRTWHAHDTLALRARALGTLDDLRGGSLRLLGWFWGVAFFAAGVVGLGTLLHLRIDAAFNNPLLAGTLLTCVLLAAALVWAGLVRGLLLGAGAVLQRLRGTARGRGLTGPRLLSSSLLVVAVLSSWLVWRSWSTVVAIGPDRLGWLASLPLSLLVGFGVGVAQAPRYRSWPRLDLACATVPLGALLLALILGEVDAVRQAALVTDTPAAALVHTYSVLADFDGDGSSALFGGPDCDDADPAIGPHARDIPDNGIDDNCVGGDATANMTLENDRAYAELPATFPDRPDIVLITVDALRADHMGLYGYRRPTTPAIDRHARNATVFERAYSQGTGTISSMPSMFTSKYPYQLAYTDDRMPPAISPRETTLAEHLRGAGYTTLGVTQVHYTESGRWRLLQGFDHVDRSLAHKKPKPGYRVTSPETLKIALDLVRRGRGSGKPYFLWAHFYDVHGDYLEHAGQRRFGKRRIDRYDGEILYTDRHVGKLLDELLASSRRPTVVVLASDHGDGFRSDRGRTNHAYGLYDELIHVPLLVWMPGARPSRVDTPVGNIDITATLLNAAGLRRPYLMGHSLVPHVFEGFRDPDRVIFSAKTFGQGARKRYRKSATGMRWKMIKWITEDNEFLFDLERDPGEKRNVIGKHADIADERREQIGAFLERTAIDTLAMEQQSAAPGS